MFLVYFITLLAFILSIIVLTRIEVYKKKGYVIMSWDVEYLSLDATVEDGLYYEQTYQIFDGYIKTLAYTINSNNPDVLILQKVKNQKNLSVLTKKIKELYKEDYYIYGDDSGYGDYGVFIISKIKLSDVYRIGDVGIHCRFFLDKKTYHIYGVDLHKTLGTYESLYEHNIKVLSDFYMVYRDSLKYGTQPICIIGNYNTFYGSKALRTIPDMGFVNLNYSQKGKRYIDRGYTNWTDINNDNIKDDVELLEIDHAYTNNSMFLDVTQYIITESEMKASNQNYRTSRHVPIKILL